MNNCIIWIPGLDDQYIIKKYIPVLENFSIIPIQVNDYNINAKYPYSTSDIKFHIHKMEATIKPIMSPQPPGRIAHVFPNHCKVFISIYLYIKTRKQ